MAYDDAISEQVRGGAELLAVQTSNAFFIHTGQIEQQFAMSRLRAIETGRTVVVASVNGRSGFIAPDGTVAGRASPAPGRCWPATSRWSRGSPPSMVVGPWLGRAAVLRRPGCRPVGAAAVSSAQEIGTGGARPREGRGGAGHVGPRIRGERVTYDGLGRVVMVIPTYDEALNLAWIVGRLREAQPGVDVMVVDDNSPDGTGKIADELAAADPQVTVAAPDREGRPRRGVHQRLPRSPSTPATT